MSALENVVNIPLLVDEFQTELAAIIAERDRLLHALLTPGLFDQDGRSLLVEHGQFFDGLSLKYFRLLSHHDRMYRLPPVIELICLSPSAFKFLNDALDRNGLHDRLCEALALHGYRALRLQDGPHHRTQLLPSADLSHAPQIRRCPLRQLLEPVFQAKVAVLPASRVDELLTVMDKSARLSEQLERVLWKEDQATGRLSLIPLSAEQRGLGFASQQVFLALRNFQCSANKSLLVDLALSAARGEETVVSAFIREDFLRLLDQAPALHQRLVGLRWRQHSDGGSLRLEPTQPPSYACANDALVQVGEARLNRLVQQLLRQESMVIPADLKATFLSLLESTASLRAVAAQAYWRVHQQTGLMMLDFDR